MSTIDQIRKDLSAVYPSDVVDALLASFTDLRENYYLGKHEPAELNGGKFVEACVRLLQNEVLNTYTPLGQPIRNMFAELQALEKASASSAHDSYRIHIPRVLMGIYNIRNRRGVGHIGGDVNANYADATLISTATSWVMAELYRLHYRVDLEEAQKIVDELVTRKIALVHDVGEGKRVLDHTLKAKDQTLLLLYAAHPESVPENELLRDIEYAKASNYRSNVLRKLHRTRMIDYSSDRVCTILPPGLRYVENHYAEWLERLN